MSNWYLSSNSLRDRRRICPTASYNTAIFWSPDGKYLYGTNNQFEFIRLTFDEDGNPSATEIITPPAWVGSRRQRLVSRGSIDSTGEAIYCFVDDPEDLWELWKLSADGAHAERLITSTAFFILDVELQIVGAGGQLAHLEREISQIVVMDLNEAVVSQHNLRHLRPVHPCDFSPCGRYLLISCGPTFLEQYVVVVDVLNGSEHEIGKGCFASWSPDGSRIAIASGDQQLCIIDWKTRRAECVAFIDAHPLKDLHGTFGAKPSWSPDGQWLLFTLTHWKRITPSIIEKLVRMPNKPTGDWEPGSGPENIAVNLQEKTVLPLNSYAYHWAWRPGAPASLGHRRRPC
ncbi:MAG: hypothetical protein WD738_08270 [Pirellulales bacterium]